MKEIEIDVSLLEAPYPLINTIKKLQELKNGYYLKMIHRQEPCKLFDYLKENNFDYFLKKEDKTILYIFLKDDLQTKKYLEGFLNV